ncbi:Fur family transcriptional regulator [Ornithinimicrobium kibberense]|uniref:Fur family transcriptional regulator n=2 Tax=Ornithinimicrobium kibberense TaxID=282060 RepID=A0ABV5UYG3_9MICO
MPTAPMDLLRSAGLRVTGPRVAVLEVLAEHPHADAAQVLERVRGGSADGAPGVSVQGVYDVLSTLDGAGVLRRIQPAHSVARYEIDGGDNHHHVVCRGCGRLHDVPCATGSVPCLDPAGPQSLGFLVDEAEVIYWGLCPSCRTDGDHSPGGGAGPSTRTTPTIHHSKENA